MSGSNTEDDVLEQWASLLATYIINELERYVGLDDGQAAAVSEIVLDGVKWHSQPANGGDLLKRGVAHETDAAR